MSDGSQVEFRKRSCKALYILVFKTSSTKVRPPQRGPLIPQGVQQECPHLGSLDALQRFCTTLERFWTAYALLAQCEISKVA